MFDRVTRPPPANHSASFLVSARYPEAPFSDPVAVPACRCNGLFLLLLGPQLRWLWSYCLVFLVFLSVMVLR